MFEIFRRNFFMPPTTLELLLHKTDVRTKRIATINWDICQDNTISAIVVAQKPLHSRHSRQ